MNNEERLKEYRKDKLIKNLIIILSILIVILEVLALFKVIHYIWGLLVFGIIYFLGLASSIRFIICLPISTINLIPIGTTSSSIVGTTKLVSYVKSPV